MGKSYHALLTGKLHCVRVGQNFFPGTEISLPDWRDLGD